MRMKLQISAGGSRTTKRLNLISRVCSVSYTIEGCVEFMSTEAIVLVKKLGKLDLDGTIFRCL